MYQHCTEWDALELTGTFNVSHQLLCTMFCADADALQKIKRGVGLDRVLQRAQSVWIASWSNTQCRSTYRFSMDQNVNLGELGELRICCIFSLMKLTLKMQLQAITNQLQLKILLQL